MTPTADTPVTPLIITHPIPPLGKVPLSANDLIFNGLVKGSHFSNVAVGPAPGRGMFGTGLVAACFQVDFSQGNYQLPFTLPKGVQLFAEYSNLIETFTTDGTTAGVAPTVALGLTAGGSEIGAVTLPAAANAVKSALIATVNPPPPAAGATPPADPTLYLNVSANTGNVTGIILVALLYFVPAPKWS